MELSKDSHHDSWVFCGAVLALLQEGPMAKKALIHLVTTSINGAIWAVTAYIVSHEAGAFCDVVRQFMFQLALY